MAEENSAIEQLSELTWQAIAERRDVVTGRRIKVPRRVPVERENSESRFSDEFPVLAHLQTALSLAANYELAHIAERFSRIVDRLRWSQNPKYTEDNCSRRFLDGYAYAAFSGPDAPILCAAPRGGLMIMGPNVTYADHHHAPKEVYLVLTPGAQWRLDEGNWFDVSPGDLVLHDSWQMHSMRTTAHPMLAFAGWVEVGDRLAIDWSGDSVGSHDQNV